MFLLSGLKNCGYLFCNCYMHPQVQLGDDKKVDIQPLRCGLWLGNNLQAKSPTTLPVSNIAWVDSSGGVSTSDLCFFSHSAFWHWIPRV